MVSADSLNLDILEQIFLYLSGNDLASVALVSNSFFSGVIPRLYRTLFFHISNAKHYPAVSTSFSALLAHPGLAIHVRNIDIRATPIYKGQVHPGFMRECTRALELCYNLCSFVYTPNSLNMLLPVLYNKPRLRDMRITSRFTLSHAESLKNIDNIEKLALDWASREVLYVLPDWAGRIRKSLTSLTLYMSPDLNSDVLELALKQLPLLLGLHVIGCPSIHHTKVLGLASHTPLLESLALTVNGTSNQSHLPNSSLSHLTHLALDVRSAFSPAALFAIVTSIKSSFPALTSVALKLSDLKADSVHPFVQKLVDGDAATLKRAILVDINLEMRTVKHVCERCQKLEVLGLPLPLKEIFTFTSALTASRSLHTLVDNDTHVTHGPKANLDRSNVTYLMQSVRKLKRLVSKKRIWTSWRDNGGRLHVDLERQKTGSSTYWFMPPPPYST